MIAAFVYVGGMFAMLVFLIVLVHHAIVAEDAIYAAEYPELPFPAEKASVRPEERLAA